MQGYSMKRFLSLYFVVLIGVSFVSRASYSKSQRLPSFELEPVHGAEMPFISHEGPGKFSNYLVLNLPYSPIKKIALKVEKTFDLSLISRGEAHITVLTSPEYEVIGKKLSMSEINKMFKETLQKTRFEALCLGSGKTLLSGEKASTFYVVVRSNDLLQARKIIYEKYISKGGDKMSFDPLEYYPHITVGFTHKDLHINHGVIKDVRSCVANLSPLGL